MIATVNTDAGFSHNSGSYAFWIISNQGKIQKAGVIRKETSSSTQCEIMAISNALHTLKHSKWIEIDKVIINTDSKGSIEFLSNIKSTKAETLKDCIEECRFLMMEVCLKYGKGIRDIKTFFDFRHVKAHTNKKDARSIVNSWCDNECKKYLKISIKNKLNR